MDEATPRADSGVVGVARRVTPAVVYIEVQIPRRVANREQGGGLPFGFQLPPGTEIPGFSHPQQRGPARASGSGFLVAPDGYILTNNHVVADADKITVSLTDGRIFPARVIGRDPTTDVALIKIDGQNFPTVTLGDDRQVQVGQPVVAIGNPLGLRSTVTTGIISAKERGAELNSLFEGQQLAVADFLQTDAVINPGNSGGPLVDLAGRVVGINSAIESPTGVYAGYGFAVPVGLARTAMDQFLKYGRVRRALLGVAITDVKAADAQAAGLSQIRGALVQSVSDGSGARAAGLQPGDIITAVDGQPVASVAVLQRSIYGRAPGSTVSLTTQRYGSQRSATVTLSEAPREEQTAAAPASAPERGSAAPKLGIQLAPVTAEIAQQFRLSGPPQGLVVTDVDPTGPSAALLQQGDVIRAALSASGSRPIRTAAELQSTLSAASSNGVVSLLVSYRDQQRVVNIPLPTR
ncbi:hypothetical protein tb265_16940 [Gemmatimonadetes bacterium T265]|nr:hypothetical protein tb265_16940 [Gemmatimonadetes bacterium T265]